MSSMTGEGERERREINSGKGHKSAENHMNRENETKRRIS